MTLPVVWLPEANADLKEARAWKWYDNVRSETGRALGIWGQTGRSLTFSEIVRPGSSNIQAACVRGRWPRF